MVEPPAASEPALPPEAEAQAHNLPGFAAPIPCWRFNQGELPDRTAFDGAAQAVHQALDCSIIEFWWLWAQVKAPEAAPTPVAAPPEPPAAPPPEPAAAPPELPKAFECAVLSQSVCTAELVSLES